jgi:hypothetical protein
MTIQELKAHFYKGKMQAYAWPGGYPLFAVTADGAALCSTCVTKERKQIFRDTHEWNQSTRGRGRSSGWEVETVTVNYEDSSLHCDNCSKRIESAYAEDEVPA